MGRDCQLQRGGALELPGTYVNSKHPLSAVAHTTHRRMGVAGAFVAVIQTYHILQQPKLCVYTHTFEGFVPSCALHQLVTITTLTIQAI